MHFQSLPRLDHAEAVLCPLAARHVEAWFQYLRLPQVHLHTSWNVQEAAELHRFVWSDQGNTPASPIRFAIVSARHGALMGTAGFHTVSPENASAEIAYDLDPACWGRGLASQVCATLVDWAHASAGMVRVQATVLASNARSAAVLARCGFALEGRLRAYRMVRGTPGDFDMYSHVVAPQVA